MSMWAELSWWMQKLRQSSLYMWGKQLTVIFFVIAFLLFFSRWKKKIATGMIALMIMAQS